MKKHKSSMVLYCVLSRKLKEKKFLDFLLINKQKHLTFPPTKFRLGEGLYQALVRPMEEDLGLPSLSYYPETELGMIPNEGESPAIRPYQEMVPLPGGCIAYRSGNCCFESGAEKNGPG